MQVEMKVEREEMEASHALKEDEVQRMEGRGLHSFTSQLNLSHI